MFIQFFLIAVTTTPNHTAPAAFPAIFTHYLGRPQKSLSSPAVLPWNLNPFPLWYRGYHEYRQYRHGVTLFHLDDDDDDVKVKVKVKS